MEKKRYHMLDEIRGFAVVCMVVFHGYFAAYMVLDSYEASRLIGFFAPAEPWFAALFIFISGVSSTLSSSNLKNALRLSAVAVGISFITLIFGKILSMNLAIYFGVIHLLAVCLFLAALLSKTRLKMPAVWMILSLALFLLSYDLVYGYPFFGGLGLSRIGVRLPYGFEGVWWLLPFGFPELSVPPMADYFPIFPWVFMFIIGRAAAGFKNAGQLPAFAEKRRIAPLGFIGRHALVIYILHQPLAFGIMFLIKIIAGV